MEEVHYCGDPGQSPGLCGGSGRASEVEGGRFSAPFIVSNQSGIGRGLIGEAQYRAVQAELISQIGEGLIDGSYFCPDAPGTASTRRKPEPGMLFEAAAEHSMWTWRRPT
jgi:D-glycero-D-manno-heptose 1,7-bisphosphate phosphatase